jgi:hypothetical protein
MYNYFTKKAADVTIALESASDRLVVMLGRLRSRADADSPAAEPTPPAAAPKPRHLPPEYTSWKF